MAVDTAAQVAQWYAEQYTEADRLTSSADGRLELFRTRELLHRYLPKPPANVLDVGGGPGTHAQWLRDEGYLVHLIDPVQRHLDEASQRARCTVELGDARHLSAADESFDVVLLLGPLYHLLDPADRAAALAEARRVVRPGGLVAAAAINRYASLAEHTSTGLLANERLQQSVGSILATQQYDGARGFTAAHFHTAGDLEREMAEVGLFAVAVYGIEGPMWGIVKAVETRDGKPLPESDPVWQSALIAARMAEPYPALLAASSHLLALARS